MIIVIRSPTLMVTDPAISLESGWLTGGWPMFGPRQIVALALFSGARGGMIIRSSISK